MRRILITGARGFIGTHIAQRLGREGYEVRSLSRSTAAPRSPEVAVIGDLLSPATLVSAVGGCDTVLHLAAHVHSRDGGIADDEQHRLTNIDGTRNLVDACIGASVARLVFVSSVKAMGEETTGAFDEATPPRPETAYGRSKLAAEELVVTAGRQHGFHASVVRPPLVYGVGNKGNLHRMIEAIDRGRFPPIPEVANRRSVVHVDNVVEAVLQVANHSLAAGQRYIVTDDRPYTTRELYVAILTALGRPVPRWTIPLVALRAAARLGDAARVLTGRSAPLDSDALSKLLGTAWYSSDRIRSELGFRPVASLEQALPSMIASYRQANSR